MKQFKELSYKQEIEIYGQLHGISLPLVWLSVLLPLFHFLKHLHFAIDQSSLLTMLVSAHPQLTEAKTLKSTKINQSKTLLTCQCS